MERITADQVLDRIGAALARRAPPWRRFSMPG
jgi:hypothetical protein